jgi:hypothetical protein
MTEEKCFTQKYIEGFGLEFPKDANKFLEVMEKSDKENWTLGQFFEALIKAFPDKKESILNVPAYADVDGELRKAELHKED